MQARTLRVFVAVLVAACSGSEVTQPTRTLGTKPLSDISDGANSNGNKDFFFLPPMVDNPAGDPNFLNNGLDKTLSPMVTITKNGGATTVLPSTPAPLNVDHYALNWQVPVSSTSTTYRVTITVGSTTLGFADVFASSNNTELKNADNTVVPLKDGRTLPIKFVIENCALVAGECSSETVNLTQGGTVTIPKGGVEIPPQPSGGNTTVTVSTCTGIPTDLPRRGSCLRVLANPPLTTPLAVPADVWVCDSGINLSSSNQEKRFTMHRYDAPNTKALPHADDQCPPSLTDAGYSLKGVVAELFSGRFRSAGKQLRGMLGPRTLYATAVLDVGAGGETDGFSDFQLLLPAKMTKCGGDGLTVTVSSVVAPKVCVTDLAGAPVQGATVHFTTSTGTVTVADVTTGATGEATTSWTISATPGANSLVATGNGIASSASNGPRVSFDPFQPFPYQGPPSPESGGTPSGAVNVLTASETFTATGSAEPISAGFFPFGSAGYTSKVIAQTDPSPSGWQLASFNPFADGFSITSSNFGPGCGSSPPTPWAPNTDILVRKKFTLSSAQFVKIRIAVDNDLIDVYLNGTKLNVGSVAHEGCASSGAADNVAFIGSGVAGVNLLAIRARDRGGVAFLDIETSAPPSGLTITNVELSSTTLQIGGPAASYTAHVFNGTGAVVGIWPSDPVVVQGWIDQGAASRAAGGSITVCCTPNTGQLPIGTWNHNFSLGAGNAPNAGTGTLVPGPATARFELKYGATGSTVVHTFTLPVTLISPP